MSFGDGLAAEPLLRVVGDVLVFGARVAAVARGAGEARARVDVVGEELRGRADAGVVEREVAVDAADRGDGLRGRRGRRRPGGRREGAGTAAGEEDRDERPAGASRLDLPGRRQQREERQDERARRARRTPADSTRAKAARGKPRGRERGRGRGRRPGRRRRGCRAVSPGMPAISAGRYFRTWNIERKYHSGRMPAGAGANGSAFWPSSHGRNAASAGEQADRDQPAHHVAQEEVGDELHRPRLPRRSTESGTLMPCLLDENEVDARAAAS